MTGKSESAGIFNEITDVRRYTSNITEIKTANHTQYKKIDPESEAAVSFTFEAVSDGEIYCYFPSSYMRECDLYVNGTKIGTYFGNETYRTVDLGNFAKGEGVTVRLELKKDDLYIRDDCTYFRSFNTDKFKESFDTLSSCQLNVTEYTDDTIKGNINIKEGCETVFTSIAYDKGWNVYCDGEKIDINKTLDALITFSLTPGEHEIVLEYRPDCVKSGILISIAGIAAFIMITVGNSLLIERSEKSRHRSALSLPAKEIPGVFDLNSDADNPNFNFVNSQTSNTLETADINESDILQCDADVEINDISSMNNKTED